MNRLKRWEVAQEYEKNWWQDKSINIDLSFYKNFADEVLNIIHPFITIDENTKILEIGSGAAGIITHIKTKFRYAIDPLEDFYSQIKNFTDYRDKDVIYSNVRGENLPFENNTFDLIIIDNVLDHCDNPELVVFEMNRVLKLGGIIFFRQNTYHLWGKFIRALMEFQKIDRGHPHTFTKKELKKIFNEYKLLELDFKKNGYFKTWIREIKSQRIFDKIKAILFVNRDKVTVILKKLSENKN
ncbi:MAG: hypothetical protein STSR0008_25040 [Ignavibacterium sp.]